jgi:hypothetical protein
LFGSITFTPTVITSPQTVLCTVTASNEFGSTVDEYIIIRLLPDPKDYVKLTKGTVIDLLATPPNAFEIRGWSRTPGYYWAKNGTSLQAGQGIPNGQYAFTHVTFFVNPNGNKGPFNLAIKSKSTSIDGYEASYRNSNNENVDLITGKGIGSIDETFEIKSNGLIEVYFSFTTGENTKDDGLDGFRTSRVTIESALLSVK